MVYQDDYKRPLDIWTEKNLRTRKWVPLISEEVSFLSLCLSRGLLSVSCLVTLFWCLSLLLSLSSLVSLFSCHCLVVSLSSVVTLLWCLSLLLSLSCGVSLTCLVSHLSCACGVFPERCPVESVSSYPGEGRVYAVVAMRV